ncbi:MAG: LolA-like outer membrane lipoprotein chaperone [Campylobacterota bacterium]|nr:LolA-like outer membrane lipoprotein chaperone [Campylobacterota bacterium]
MKHIFLLIIFFTLSFASLNELNSFEADFKQSITDEKEKVLTYSGHIVASKPQNAIWNYTKPIKKDIFVNSYSVTVIEPEIEQVIIREVDFNLDFFKMIQNAKEIEKNKFLALYKETKFTIITQNNTIKSISYIDEFENSVEIIFENQKQNRKIDMKIFQPIIPNEYDIIRD